MGHLQGPLGVELGARPEAQPLRCYGIIHAMKTIAVWNCADEQMSYAGQEVQSIESHRGGDVDVVTAGRGIDWDGLAKFIAAVDPEVFHFIGHGTRSGELVVNEAGGTVERSIESVLKVVRAASPALEGVYLSGCYTSATGPEPLEHLAPTAGWVIGTSAAVDDDIAAEFTRRFYEHFVALDFDVVKAFNIAKEYLGADLGDETPHGVWMTVSSMPPVDAMGRTVFTALRNIFSRPAMHVPMRHEASIGELDDALQDISHALGTGEARSRRTGALIQSAYFPVEWLYEPRISKFVRVAGAAIASIRRDLAVLSQGAGGQDRVFGNVLNFDQSVSPAEWMRRINQVDRGRNKIIRAMNDLLRGSGVPNVDPIRISFSSQDIKGA